MSELMHGNGDKVESLLKFSLGIINGENGRELMDKYRYAIENVTPRDIVEMETRQLALGVSIDAIKETIGKVINVFFKYLKEYPWKRPEPETFLFELMAENRALEAHLAETKELVKLLNKETTGTALRPSETLGKLRSAVAKLFDFEVHYDKKENILFPTLEKRWEFPRPLQVMWSIDSDIRKSVRALRDILAAETPDLTALNRELGKYYFLAHGMVFKEELVVYPLGTETLTAEEFDNMRRASFELGFAFIETPPRPARETADTVSENPDMLNLETGTLTREQIIQMLNTLPVDMTLIDETDTVVYFSNPEDRLFSRSKAVIGRTVQNCHPPESVHMVNELLEAFRKGEKDRESFWITVGGRFVLIQYFAMRAPDGSYRGCLEVSQDVTGIRSLTGEKRLIGN
ncbi:MAG: DUF438 domain-containing protein [Acidobacteria bacterium]|nr:DUF438 domain-containing protein [Acidobacteriota bacterium]